MHRRPARFSRRAVDAGVLLIAFNFGSNRCRWTDLNVPCLSETFPTRFLKRRSGKFSPKSAMSFISRWFMIGKLVNLRVTDSSNFLMFKLRNWQLEI
ncbi:hypothetical protein Y032_0531g3036 [Ancylostoma ceylanicum]|uniref:Uncharacterized protein n=1 Tax=Ancylostoma ceylanicum TaxID=53326 RepID=A0A016WRP0_9BILA|nr:hypothetical protein Y032_0531g3036 [Ancylostoma ceylanicum]